MIREHPIRWLTAAPLWLGAAAPPSEKPTLLRFHSDTFMDDLAAVLSSDPKKLAEHVARPESFRPAPIGADAASWKAVAKYTKLYQPVHGQFSLVAASLVCRIPGLPDRGVHRPADRTGFVVRKLDEQGHELAWVVGANKSWQSVAGRERFLAPSEEVNPLFPMPYAAASRRCLHVGLIPTSSRETFHAAPQQSPFVSEDDPRLAEFEYRVVEALAELRESNKRPAPPGGNEARQEAQVDASMFLLLDFADVLKKNAAALQADLVEGPPPAPATNAYPVYSALVGSYIDASTWLDAIKHAWRQRDRISGDSDAKLDRTFNLAASGTSLNLVAFQKDTLMPALGKFVQPPSVAGPVAVPKLSVNGEARYVIRCAYQRPTCRPPHPDLVSEASEPFAIAPFFDSDAPARPIRIPLPADTSVKGLRKFARNVGFVTSSKLRQQIHSVMDGEKTLKGELSSGKGFSFGEICSFSLPIITICAMVVLLIFIIVLNIGRSSACVSQSRRGSHDRGWATIRKGNEFSAARGAGRPHRLVRRRREYS
jgi:hypothetical protein